ncbi:MAG: hypothetical protein RIR70_1710 [Pseudomonadota bacterium]|jgi:adenylyltransferase/sulfurtransferase
MQDEALLRYSRHILLPEIGIEGQERIRAAKVLIIGAGGLGSPAALYLAAAGVGQLTIADADTVELSNLQRQILHNQESVGTLKVASAQSALARINPEVYVRPLPVRLEGQALEDEVAHADVVLDCCDNFETRYDVNRACVRFRKPLVSGAAIRFDGQIVVFDFRNPEIGCYNCLFPEGDEGEQLRCAVTGVFAPLTGVVGAIQAGEALQLASSAEPSRGGYLWTFNAKTLKTRSAPFIREPMCKVCK